LKDLMQAVEAVADAQTGELERLKEFGITKNMIQDQAKALGSNPINNQGQITDTKAFNAALFSLMEKRFKGGMEMQSKSFKGMLSNAKDFMGSLGRQLGKPLFDYEKKQLEGFLGTLNRLQQDGSIDRFVSRVHSAGAVIANELAFARKVAGAAFRGIWAVASPVFALIKKNWADIKPFVQGVAIAIGAVAGAMGVMKTYTMAATLAMRLLNLAMLTNPVGWIILGIGLLIGLFIKLNGGVEGTKKVLAGWFNQLKAWYNSDQTQAWVQKAIAFFQQLAVMAGQAFAWLVQQAKTYWPVIQAAIITAFNYVRTNVLPILQQLLTVAIRTFKQIWAVAQPLGAALVKFFVAIAPSILGLVKGIAWVVMNILWPALLVVWKVIAGVAAAVIPVVATIAASIMRAFTAILNWAAVIWPAVAKIVGWVFQYIQFLWAAIGPFIMAALQVIGSIIVGGFQVIMAVVKFVWNTISSIIEIAWAIISGIIQTALGILTGDWKMAWDGIKTIFEGIWNGILDFFKGIGHLFYDSGKAIITTLVDGIKAMAEAPVKAVKNVLDKVRDFLPFSDAKKGPLSELTYSGGAIMTTLSTGVNRQAGSLQDAVGSAFSNSGVNVSPNAVGAVTAPPAASAGPSFTIGSLVEKIELHATKDVDADGLVDQFIDRLYERSKEAAAILSSADKGALV
jgi:phage-related protein